MKLARVLAAAVAIALVAGACSFGGGDAEPSPTASAPPAGTVGGGTPTAVAAVTFSNARSIEVVATHADLPADLALIVAREGELWRIHRAPNGALEERLLFDPFAYSGKLLITYRNIHHLGAILPSGQQAIAVCTTGECSSLGTSSEDALVTIFRSRDGGVTWEASDELDGVALIAAGATLDSLVLQRLPREGDSRTGRFEWWPGPQAIDPPANLNRDGGAVVLGGGVIGGGRAAWWTADGRLVDSAGEMLIDLGSELPGGTLGRGIAVLPSADGTRLAVTWVEMLPDGSAEAWRWSIYDRANGRYEVSDILEAPFPMVPTAWLSESTLLLSADLTWEALGEEPVTPELPRLPVILDIVEGTATAIDVPGGTLGQGWVVAVQQGPFAEVNAGEGDCLNLRSEAASDAGVLRCIAHATLLERLSPLDGAWVNVRTSDGVTGWVSGEFVRRADSTPAATPTPAGTPTE